MIKRTLCLMLSIITVISSFSLLLGASAAEEAVVAVGSDEAVSTVAAVTDADGTMSLLASLVKKFPDGKYWNHMGSDKNSPDTTTDKPCSSHRGCSWVEGACSCNSFDRSIQCMGYAHKVAYDICGVSPRSSFTKSTKLNVDSLRVGDIIRFRQDGHSICVTGIKGTQISFTDCNWDYKCGIRWGVMDISYIKNRGFTYVLHLNGNDRKNTDLYFFDHIEDYENAEPEQTPKNAETWTMSDSNLNVRDKASVDGKKVGSIPANSKFTVTEKQYSDDYLWGYVTYGNIEGWAALNYSEYESGYYQKPLISNAKSVYESYELKFNWDEVGGANYYLFRLYDENKKVIKQFNVYGASSATVTVEADGKYYAKVFSRCKHASSWVLGGNLIGFDVEKAEEAVEISSISLSNTSLSIVQGEKATLEAKVEPSDYNESLVWTSSAPETVSVENGTVTALACGKATVYCKNSDGTVSAQCAVTVKPENITNPAHVAKETTTNAITFTWDEVSYADGYDIHRYNAAKKKYEKMGSTDTAKYTDATVEAGKSYYYLIRAFVNTESGRVNGANTKIKFATRPLKVTGLKQTASSTGSVTLSWNETDNATVYVLYKYDSANKKYEKVKVLKTNSMVVSVAPGESRYYRVYAATKVNGSYLYSAVSDKLFTVAGPEKAELTAKSDKKGVVSLSWDKVDSAYYYYLYRYTSSTGYKRIATLKSNVTSYTDKDVKSGTKYYYKVRAVALKGGVAGYGLYSDQVSVKAK